MAKLILMAFGVGGYSRAILEAANCNLIAIDRDPDAIKIARHLHQDYPNRFTVMQGVLGDIQALCDKSLYDDQAIAEERKLTALFLILVFPRRKLTKPSVAFRSA